MENYKTSRLKHLKRLGQKNNIIKDCLKKLEDEYGDNAYLFFGDATYLVYPNILLPTSVLSATYTSTGAANYVYAGVQQITSKNYNFGISITAGAPFTSYPQVLIGVFSQPTGSNFETPATYFNAMTGYYTSVYCDGTYFYTTAITLCPSLITLGSLATNAGNFYLKEGGTKLTFCQEINTGNIISTSGLTYNADLRYVHIYRFDNGGSINSSISLNMIPSIL